MLDTIDNVDGALGHGRPAAADRTLSGMEADAFQRRDAAALARIWPRLAAARRQRRIRAAAGRIDLHTHTTASDGRMTVEELLCRHFISGQISICDHNTIASLPEARRLIAEGDLEIDLFLGVEVIATHENRPFEFQAIAPRLSAEFSTLCRDHRARWDRACERFVDDLVARDDFFEQSLWRKIVEDHRVGGDFAPIRERYAAVRRRIAADPVSRQAYLDGNKSFDMGSLWHEWGLAGKDDPPMLAHRFFSSMRAYAMNAYCDELDDGFDYATLARRFHSLGCLISHNHPNYWDEDFVGHVPHELQTAWIRQWALQGVIDALEVWTPPFQSRRVPDYWHRVCCECGLIPMAGSDCHHGREQQLGGRVEDHPEVPPLLFTALALPFVNAAERAGAPWEKLTAWREVLEVDYAHEIALDRCVALAESLAEAT